MDKLEHVMLEHPYISVAVILPFALILVLGICSVLLNIIHPGIIAFWLTGCIYTLLVGRSVSHYYQRPFW